MSTEEGEKKAKEFNVMYIETSAKAGYNVKALFRKIANALPGMDQNAADANNSQSEYRLNAVGFACWQHDLKLFWFVFTVIDVKLNPAAQKPTEGSSCAC